MKRNPGDTINEEEFSASGVHSLKEHLQTLDADQVLAELNEKTSQAQARGEELDPHIVLAYYDVLDGLAPIDIPAGAKTSSISSFVSEHPNFTLDESVPAQQTPKRRIFMNLRHHRVAAALLTLVILATFTSVAVALEWPQKIYIWGIDTFQLGPTCGDMRLETPTEDGYSSLEDALSDYGVSTYTPSWMPKTVKLDDIAVSKSELWTSFYAIYVLKEDSSDFGAVKITVYNDLSKIPTVKYEDNGEGSRYFIELDGMDVVVSENEGDFRATWKVGNCTGIVYGGFSQSEIEKIVRELKLEENVI